VAKKPPRFVKKRNTYFHVGYKRVIITLPGGQSKVIIKRPYTSLGNDLQKAILKWAEVEVDLTVEADTFNALAAKYKQEVLTQKRPNTQDMQGRFMKKLCAVFGHMQLNEIKPPHIAEYLDTSEFKITANREIQLMSAMYTKAIRWGWCETNPTQSIKRNEEKQRTRYITDEEFMILRAGADEELLCIIDIAYSTGLRISDIRNIRRKRPDKEIMESRVKKQDIEFSYLDGDLLYSEHIKTGARQYFYLTGFLLDAVNRAKAMERKVSSPFLFCTRQGKPHSKSGFDSKWKRFREKVGLLDIHFHDIRAKAGTDAKMMGKNHQALLGHTDISQSEKYVKARMIEEIEPLDFNDKLMLKSGRE
jgi:integrase